VFDVFSHGFGTFPGESGRFLDGIGWFFDGFGLFPDRFGGIQGMVVLGGFTAGHVGFMARGSVFTGPSWL
jgi:hypothetical protein